MNYSKSINIISLFVVSLMLSLSMNFTLVYADDDLEDYISQCPAPQGLHDPEEMANALISPEKFLQFISEISQPAAAKSMVQCLITPESRQAIISRMTNPNKIGSAINIIMTPQTINNWIASTANMQTYDPLITYMNPKFYTDWMIAMMHPINAQ